MTGLASTASYADDSAFLACGQYTYREMRVACLEAALNDAIMKQNQSTVPGNQEQIKGYRRPVTGNTTTYQDRVDAFGRENQPRVVSTGEGKEEFYDQISGLNKIKPNIWDITLNSGQVWRQVYPKRFDLRESDTVRIYPSRWGDNFRLTTSRLSGFIQVSRIK